jgi:DNA-binding GntR family transcriptional regulator
VLNAEFHLQIAEISGNHVLKYLLKRNFEHIILRINLDNFTPESAIQSHQEHRNLLESLRRKNISACASIIQKHIQSTRDYIIWLLSRKELTGFETMDFFEEETTIN